VEYTNLLSFTLVENKLEKNFKSIVEALLLAQSEGSQLKEDFNSLAKASNREIGHLN
jgi:FtsZ-binding cell division protein ZapB